MKIAITSRSKNIEDKVDPRFVHARGFLIYDTESEQSTFIDNEKHLDIYHSDGIEAARRVISRGVKAILTGYCGPKAFNTLMLAGIKIYLGVVKETVGEAIEKFRKGEFGVAHAADVGDFW